MPRDQPLRSRDDSEAIMTAPQIVLLAMLLMLSGCGESASEYHENEKRDAVVKDQDREIMKLQDRVHELEQRK